MKRDANSKLQTTQKKPAKRGLKLPPRDLADWIRLANLIPPGYTAPEVQLDADTKDLWPRVLEWIARLEDPLRAVRAELMARSDYISSEFPDEFANLYVRVNYPEKPATSSFAAYVRDNYAEKLATFRAQDVLRHYERIRIANTCLRILSKTDSELAMDSLEGLLSTLRYTELPYLRQCGVCDRIFYAKRKTQKGCTTQHSTILYKRQRYADKLKEEERKRDKAKRDKAKRDKAKRAKREKQGIDEEEKLLLAVQKGARTAETIEKSIGLKPAQLTKTANRLIESGELANHPRDDGDDYYMLQRAGRERLKKKKESRGEK